MTESEHPQSPFHVEASGVVRRMIVQVYRQAVQEGRGESVVAAYRRTGRLYNDSSKIPGI